MKFVARKYSTPNSIAKYGKVCKKTLIYIIFYQNYCFLFGIIATMLRLKRILFEIFLKKIGKLKTHPLLFRLFINVNL